MRIPSNILYMRNLCDFVFRSLQSYLCNMMAVLAPTLYFYNCIKCYKNLSLIVYRSILVLPSMTIALLRFCWLACFTEHFHSLHKLTPPIVLIPRKVHSWTKTLANASSHALLFCHLYYLHKVEHITAVLLLEQLANSVGTT